LSRSAVFMWRSLGGFDTDERVQPSPEKLRAAFDALDEDGSGTISIDEVVTSLAVSNPGVSVESAQRMIAFAGEKTEGEVNFDEFSRMINYSFSRMINGIQFSESVRRRTAYARGGGGDKARD
jgi:hypothetical protein